MSHLRERRHRLSRDCYVGKIICAFTTCIFHREKLFLSGSIFDAMAEMLQEALKKYSCKAHVYLFMPDHCHLLIEGEGEESDVWKCIVHFKQKSGYWLAQHNYRQRWQKDFYDHILRKDEDVIKHVHYILGNPVRKRLVDDWKVYPFKSSTVYNLAEW